MDRTFLDLSNKDIKDVEQVSTLERMGWSGAFGWDRLLESSRIMIISEAGTGKTHECKVQRDRLWSKGEAAFYVELSELAKNELLELLSIEEMDRLDAWLANQSGVATFFLDSIDELNLTHGSLRTALNRLARVVNKFRDHVRVIITSRPVDLSVDLSIFQDIFENVVQMKITVDAVTFADIAMGRMRKKVIEAIEEDVPALRMVALMPLSDGQIKEMAEHNGINDPIALLNDIRARNAEDFARRPQDLIELCADWKEHRCIRTHRAQVEQNIRVKLKPLRDAKEAENLSPERVYEGASRLALASVLTRKLTIRHNLKSDQFTGIATSALAPELVLNDWTPIERKTLLERALFGVAGYGRVRFHHRSVIEFLAASCLSSKINQGASIKAIKRLLFAETPQAIKVVRPSMRAVSAWLAAGNDSIFYEVLNREPEVLLNYGDPETLSISQRTKALRAYVKAYGRGGWRGMHIPSIQLHRFASSDLSNEVLNLWSSEISNPEVRELLIDLMGQGKMKSCADILYSVATDASESEGARLTAISSLAKINDVRLNEIIKLVDSSSKIWPESLVRGVISKLFPEFIQPNRLCEIFQKLNNLDRTIDEFAVVVPKKIEDEFFEPGYLSELGRGITELVLDGLNWTPTWPHLLSPKAHFLPLLALICQRLIRTGDVSSDVLYSSVVAVRLDRNEPIQDDAIKELKNEITKLAPLVREKIFWIDDAFNQKFNHKDLPVERLFAVLYNDGPLVLNRVYDESWVRGALSDKNHPLDVRKLMLEAALNFSDTKTIVEEIMQEVIDVNALISRVDEYLTPPTASGELRRLNRRHDCLTKLGKLRNEKDHASWVRFSEKLIHDSNALWKPESEENTCFNLWRGMEKSDGGNHFSKWNRQLIVDHFNEDTAARFRTALMKIWRNNRPALSSEKSGNTFPISWAIGLTGVAAEADDPEWAEKISENDAELAARYALVELNGFPDWLEALVTAKPFSVEKTLGPELLFELATIEGSSSFSTFLQNLKNSSSAINKIFLPRLHAWFSEHSGCLEPSEEKAISIDRLERVIQILIEHGDVETRSLIQSKAESQLVNPVLPFAITWLTTLLRLDPFKGVEAIEKFLATIKPKQNGIGVKVFANLFGQRCLNINLSDSLLTPDLLSRLVVLSYTHISPSDDYVHLGVFSPDERDHAERGRSALLSTLLSAKGEEAWRVKLEVSDNPIFSDFRDRLHRVAHETASEEMDSRVWSEDEVAQFEARGESTPKTTQEMFSLLMDRLDDLDEVLLQDDSPRELWASIDEEKLMRREISRVLRNLANDTYLVNQEEVTADENRTDIRLHTTQQQAVIELKIGEKNWSGLSLRSVLKDQLVAKYMAVENCRSGCLLITVSTDRNWQHPDSNDMLDVDGLLAMLSEEARKLENGMGASFRLHVKVLDLRSRINRT